MKKCRNLITRLFTLTLVLTLLLTLAPTVFAVEAEAAIETSGNLVEPRYDETSWVFSELYGDGVIYKRLWSHTQGKWLTDWEFVGYA